MPVVRELHAGVSHWQAAHPDWKPSEEWGQMVSSYAIDEGEHVLLFDPLALPPEIDELLDGREAVIVLTCPWHARDAESIAERLSAPIYVPAPDEGDPSPLPGRVFAAGDRLPVGVEAFPGMDANDVILWVESRGAVIAGDTLVDIGNGLEIPAGWLPEGMTRERIAEGLRPLLERRIEHVLPTHGEPTDRSALERALA
jgi:glyoxylase-like metal-dependent hydrolase (beta-lactamase superfamily II)